jgi:predicted ATP-grasp superfamily ATP-dependent carboligase
LTNILISPVGGQVAVGIIEYFKNGGHTVTGIDSSPEATGGFFCDEFRQVPPVGDPGYGPAIRDVMSGRQIDMFVSWLDPEIAFWNEQDRLGTIGEMRARFAMSFRRDLDALQDKLQLHSRLGKHGIDTPATRLLSDDGLASIDFPIIVKPRVSSGSRHTHVAWTGDDAQGICRELRRRALPLDGFVAQTYVDGAEYTVDLFSSSGSVENAVIRSRLEHRGVSLRGEIVEDAAIEGLARNVCGALELDGLNNVQIIRGGNAAYVTDVNLRPSGTIMFSVSAGVDMLQNVIERMEGRPITRYGPPRPLKMTRYLREFYYR